MARRGGSELREWIMFFVAIGIVLYFALTGTELSPWWLMMLGAMLGLSVLVTGVQRAWMGGADRDNPDPPTPPPSGGNLQGMIDRSITLREDPKP